MPPYSPKVNVSIRNFAWEKDSFPESEDALGEKLFSLVVQRSLVGQLPLELWLFTENAIQAIAFRTRVSHRQVSAFCGLDGVHCAALLGALAPSKEQRIGQVFIEWDNCRWWFGRQPLMNDGSIAFQIPKVTKASSGDGKPVHLGGWFSTARRLGLKATLLSGEGLREH